MVAGKFKSRTFKRKQVRTPGARTVVRYVKPNNSAPVCPVTGQKLHGLKRGRDIDAQRRPKSQKRVARPFGGHLSSKAARQALIARARAMRHMQDGDEQ